MGNEVRDRIETLASDCYRERLTDHHTMRLERRCGGDGAAATGTEMLYRFVAHLQPGAKPWGGGLGFMNTVAGSRTVSAAALTGRSRTKKIRPSMGCSPT